MTANLLEIRDVHKTYDKGAARIVVLSGASLQVAEGDKVSIQGQSGAGKSTLLHLLGTLDVPDRGQVLYRGHNLMGYSPNELAEFRNRELGFVFQFHHLLGEFDALENVMMPCLIRRMPRRKAREHALDVLHEVGLGHRANHRPGELSGGEQQRIALARALVLKPSLLLADEVTGNLDDTTGERIHDLLFELNESRGITLIVVTHNRKFAERMPRQIILSGGQLMEQRL